MGQNQSRPNDEQPAAGDERQEDSDDEVVGSAAPMDQGRFGTCAAMLSLDAWSKILQTSTNFISAETRFWD